MFPAPKKREQKIPIPVRRINSNPVSKLSANFNKNLSE